MLHRIREQVGTAGLIVAIVALIAALAGGALAANGGGSDGKATASAKGKRGPRGPKGATGPAGPIGPAGAPGKDGTNGTNGKDGVNGSNGKSVALGTATGAECEFGGTTVEVSGEASTKKPVCNGEPGAPGTNGSPWTAGGTLPANATETGTFRLSAVGPAFESAGLSFTIPLAAPLACPGGLGSSTCEVHVSGDANFADFDDAGAGTAGCTGSIASPTAPSGHLCVYGSGTVAAGPEIKDPSTDAFGAAVAGAYISVGFSSFSTYQGTFAVTG